jgi:hypothetical protein
VFFEFYRVDLLFARVDMLFYVLVALVILVELIEFENKLFDLSVVDFVIDFPADS